VQRNPFSKHLLDAHPTAYKAGAMNGNADALSRLPFPETLEETPIPGDTIKLMELLEAIPLHSGQIRVWTRRDPVLSKVH
jgi:hypothetical protein